MPSWNVRVIRNVTEFGMLTVEADTPEQAVDSAIVEFSEDLDGKLVTDKLTGYCSCVHIEARGGDR